jgi:hypothetical protein
VIVPMGKVRVLAQAPQVHVDEDDVARGFVDVECASQIEVRSNSRCRVAFRPKAAWFGVVRVYGFPRVLEVDGECGGAYLRPLERQRLSVYRLSYRFELRPETLPGLYRWPLEISLQGEWEEGAARQPAVALAVPPRPSA